MTPIDSINDAISSIANQIEILSKKSIMLSSKKRSPNDESIIDISMIILHLSKSLNELISSKYQLELHLLEKSNSKEIAKIYGIITGKSVDKNGN